MYCGQYCRISHGAEHNLECEALKATRVSTLLRITGYPSLVEAAGNSDDDDFNAVRCLIAAGADVGATDSQGRSALYCAAQLDNWRSLRHLEFKGADINQATHTGRTALLEAAATDRIEMVEWLLKKGADVNQAPNNGRSALWAAAHTGRMEMLHLLADNDGDLEKADSCGATPLWAAAEANHLDAVRFFLGGDEDEGEFDPTFPYPTAEHFLECDSLDCPDTRGRTPTHIAALRGHFDVARALAKAGADLTI